jgi:hypothetical protein
MGPVVPCRQYHLDDLDELGFSAEPQPNRIRTMSDGPLRDPDRLSTYLAGERGGLPLVLLVSAANANDATMFEALLDDIPPILMPSGRRRRRPGKVHAAKAYDHRR